MAAAYRAYFFDSSGLVKRYVQETGTAWVRRLTSHNPSTIIYVVRITAVEVTSRRPPPQRNAAPGPIARGVDPPPLPPAS